VKLFARLDLARATLSDPARRAKYIEELSKPVTAATAGDISSAEATLEFRKAEALLKKNDREGAEGHLRRAVHLAPANVEIQVLLVWLQARPEATPQRLRELVGELDRLLARDKDSERAYLYRGQLRKRLDLLKEAHADFTRAAELNPSNVDAVREVRIYKMRQDRAAAPPAPPASEGVGGFFKKLFKR
jgi:tetratricopeptide (TPR) repeat protein